MLVEVPSICEMYSYVQPDAWVCLRLPSDSLKVVQVTPNT